MVAAMALLLLVVFLCNKLLEMAGAKASPHASTAVEPAPTARRTAAVSAANLRSQPGRSLHGRVD